MNIVNAINVISISAKMQHLNKYAKCKISMNTSNI